MDEASNRYIAGAIYTVRTTAVQTNGSINYSVQRTDKSYVYNDHLGSLDVVVNHLGQVTHTASFDAWGNRRNAENWTGAFVSSSLTLTNYNNPITKRGFTGHEMLDGTGLIHMNGRIFDPRLARFMQADPFIQAAANTQSYNRYSYVWNNPLNATDPSGYILEKLFNIGGRYIMRPLFKAIGYENSQILIAIGSIACGPFAPACAAAATYDLNRAYGASPRQSMMSAGRTGLSMAAFQAVGGAFGKGGTFAEAGAGKKFAWAMSQGMVGGFTSAMGGGRFGHGFASAFVTKYADVNSIIGTAKNLATVRVITAAIIGGTVSEATGGKFANGAVTAAMMQAVNGEGEAAREEDRKWQEHFALVESLLSVINEPPALPQGVVDFAAGLGDTILFGFGDELREYVGVDGGIDSSSDAYSYGEWAGIAVATATGGYGGLRAAGTKGAGKEFSHWLPNRMGGPRTRLNGNFVSPAKHALSDPYRYRFMPRIWKEANPPMNSLMAQWTRIPYVYKGAAGGGIYGSLGTQ